MTGEWMLIAWLGSSLQGGPLMERFATKAECETAMATIIEMTNLARNLNPYRCIEVRPLGRHIGGER